MSPITHLLISWQIAGAGQTNKRERLMITLAGILPDFDGAGILIDYWHGPDQPFYYWSTYHHILGHNIGFGLLMALSATILATRRWKTALLVLISFHLHLLGDLLGSKGPDGYQWPIPYLLPFSNRCQWLWHGQWQLNAWPNILLTVVLCILTLYSAWKNGISPLEFVSKKADRAMVKTLRDRFGHPEKK